jgi:hypothetical protein
MPLLPINLFFLLRRYIFYMWLFQKEERKLEVHICEFPECQHRARFSSAMRGGLTRQHPPMMVAPSPPSYHPRAMAT